MEERKWIFGLREDQRGAIWRKGLKQRKCWPPWASIDLSSSFAGCSDMQFWQHMLTDTGLSSPTLGYFWTQTLSMARWKEMGWWGTALEPAPSLLQTQLLLWLAQVYTWAKELKQNLEGGTGSLLPMKTTLMLDQISESLLSLKPRDSGVRMLQSNVAWVWTSRQFFS